MTDNFVAANMLADAESRAAKTLGSGFSTEEWAQAITDQIQDEDLRAVLIVALCDYIQASQKRKMASKIDEARRP